ncbi:unnamed protein product [Dovyalis caffra]|uniref:Uncharacterized protein n=1 Tax=Dovyalis caffra TaxID=77055 RepID=A0AAV1QWD9_9ROSI|nr:unnamed protein product [Dovyalis caffra]
MEEVASRRCNQETEGDKLADSKTKLNQTSGSRNVERELKKANSPQEPEEEMQKLVPGSEQG